MLPYSFGGTPMSRDAAQSNAGDKNHGAKLVAVAVELHLTALLTPFSPCPEKDDPHFFF